MTNRNQLGAFGYYMIGYFDVLGQSNKLLDLPTNPEPKDVVEHLRQTAAAVLKVRERFDGFFDGKSHFSSSLPPDERKLFLDHTMPRLVRWGFSDSYTVAVPIMHGDDKRSAMVSGIYRTMMAACSMWMTTLSAGHPLRGGIEIGPAVDIGPAGEPAQEVYGPALVEAYRLESRIAKYPRVMVGRECIRFLRTAARDVRRFMDRDVLYSANIAKRCLRMLREVNEKHGMLDSLGDDYLEGSKTVAGFRDLCQGAYDQVVKELRQAEANKDCKLVPRYETLQTYFREHAVQWRIDTSSDNSVGKCDSAP